MFEVMRRFQAHLPTWMQDWLEFIIPGAQILLIIGAAWLLNRLVRRLIARAGRHYGLPPELLVPLRGVFRWILIAATVPLVLERLGVSATVLWTAFTDRKSTRLNSSHLVISYAVFCLKKKR